MRWKFSFADTTYGFRHRGKEETTNRNGNPNRRLFSRGKMTWAPQSHETALLLQKKGSPLLNAAACGCPDPFKGIVDPRGHAARGLARVSRRIIGAREKDLDHGWGGAVARSAAAQSTWSLERACPSRYVVSSAADALQEWGEMGGGVGRSFSSYSCADDCRERCTSTKAMPTTGSGICSVPTAISDLLPADTIRNASQRAIRTMAAGKGKVSEARQPGEQGHALRARGLQDDPVVQDRHVEQKHVHDRGVERDHREEALGQRRERG